MLPIFDNLREVTLLAGLVYTVVFYAVTWYTMEKQLNLD